MKHLLELSYAIGAGILRPMVVELRPEWGSHILSHRADIRRALLERFGARMDGDVRNLSQRPRLRDGYISISHAPGLGGFVCAPSWVGLDIEVTERVTPELAVRVSHFDEFAASPDPASLWCAKEAVFKALQFGQQPTTIKDIQVTWPTATTFTVANGKNLGGVMARGEIKLSDRHTVATAVVMPCD